MVKIKKIETKGKYSVCKGKIYLLPILGSNANMYKEQKVLELGTMRYFPLIISDEEKIEESDDVLSIKEKIVFRCNTKEHAWTVSGLKELFVKIIVTPEQFSPIQLNEIRNGGIQDGDTVMLMCEYDSSYQGLASTSGQLLDETKEYKLIFSGGHVNILDIQHKPISRIIQKISIVVPQGIAQYEIDGVTSNGLTIEKFKHEILQIASDKQADYYVAYDKEGGVVAKISASAPIIIDYADN